MAIDADYAGLGFINPFRRAFFFVAAFSLSVALNVFLVHEIVRQTSDSEKRESEIQSQRVSTLNKDLERVKKDNSEMIRDYIKHLNREDSIERKRKK